MKTKARLAYVLAFCTVSALAGMGINSLVRADQMSSPLGQGTGGPSLFAPIGTVAGIGTTCTAAHLGQLYVVTDATAGSEGATCAGSGSAKQLAFCNGTNWKCF